MNKCKYFTYGKDLLQQQISNQFIKNIKNLKFKKMHYKNFVILVSISILLLKYLTGKYSKNKIKSIKKYNLVFMS
jgi:hypothetical protein